MPGSTTTPGHMSTRVIAPTCVAFHTHNGVGTRDKNPFAAQWLAVHSPTDASPTPSRTSAHGSGPMRFATPSSLRTFTAYSVPVSGALWAI